MATATEQANPAQFSPRTRIRLTWPEAEDDGTNPVFVCRPLTLDEFCELFELREICRRPRNLDDIRRLRELVAAPLVYWENQRSLKTDEPVAFDRTQLGEIVDLARLLLLSSMMLAGGTLKPLDQKKADSPH